MKELTSFMRYPLAYLPTPVEPLQHLSDELDGPQLWIKRDDRTGLAGGGNKARKLEFLLADALEKQCDLLITAGGPQSNHCRQTAAAALGAGLRCELVLGGTPPPVFNGNLLLDDLLGAKIHWTQPEQRSQTMAELAELRKAEGYHPYIIPVGGSNALGALAYVLAMQEFLHQLDLLHLRMDAVVIATSSGGTQAGLAVGARLFGYTGQILGISIDRIDSGPQAFRPELADLANDLLQLLEMPREFVAEDFCVDMEFLGQGYGKMGDLERQAIRLTARSEGVLLDPVYTGRAMGGLLEKIRGGAFTSDQNVLFWHTGGAPALYAYAEELCGAD